MEFYNTIELAAQAEFKDKGSKFLAYAYPINAVDDFKNLWLNLKKEHPKAAHLCFAYRIGLDGNLFRAGDDGEPSGTAGKPILGQIDSREITNCCIIVVRYFGGTLLGVPGLINAYKTAASLVLQIVPIIRKPVLKNISLQFDYTQMNAVMIILKHLQADIIKKESLLFCNLIVAVPLSRVNELKYSLNNLRNVEINEIMS